MIVATQIDRQSKRDQRLGLALSACVHAVVLLLLSLIALGKKATTELSLIASNSPDASLSLLQIPDFELEPMAEAATQPEARTTNETVDLSIDIVLPLSASSATSLVADFGAASALPESDPGTSGVDLDKAELLSGVNARTVAAIQGRVGKAGGKKGEVQFALAWKDINDVDLHVIAPSGERVSHQHRRSQCKGMLDVDMNIDGESTEPVENIRWIIGAPTGRYTVLVNLFQVHAAGRRGFSGSEFELLAQLGDETKIKNDSVSLREQVAVFRFHYVPERIPQPQRRLLLAELERLQEQEEDIARPLLQAAKQENNPQRRDRLLNDIIMNYTHTDSAIEAMRLLGGSTVRKR